MAKFKVTLVFLYDSEEDVSEWNVDSPFDNVETKNQAEEMAYLELENNNPREFSLDVEELEED